MLRPDLNSARRIAISVFFVSFTLALLLNYVARPLLHLKHPVSYDGYFELAQNLVAGNGYVFEKGGHPVFHRPPLYVWLLTPGTLLPEPFWRAYVSLLNATLLAGTVALVFTFANQIAGLKTARIASLLVGFNPIILYTIKTAHPATCQMLAYTALVFTTWRLWQRDSRDGKITIRQAVDYGALLVATSLIHGTMIAQALLLLALAFALAYKRRDWNLAGCAFAATITFLLLLSPWTIRNYRVTGRFIPVAGNTGLAYFAGNARWGITKPPAQPGERYDEAELRHIGLDPTNVQQKIQFRGFTSFKDEIFAHEQAKLHIKNHPAALAKKILLQTIEFYFPAVYDLFPAPGGARAQLPLSTRLKTMEEKAYIWISIQNALLLTLAFAGFASLFRDKSSRLLAIYLLLAWIAFVFPYLPFLAWANHNLYTFGTMPIISIFAAKFITRRAELPSLNP
jgi:4-amino-4-deoxy-L-arabinose transferase-like glycosyltransferase